MLSIKSLTCWLWTAAAENLKYFSLIENKAWHFIQIISKRYSIMKCQALSSLKKYKNCHTFVSNSFYPESAKGCSCKEKYRVPCANSWRLGLYICAGSPKWRSKLCCLFTKFYKKINNIINELQISWLQHGWMDGWMGCGMGLAFCMHWRLAFCIPWLSFKITFIFESGV